MSSAAALASKVIAPLALRARSSSRQATRRASITTRAHDVKESSAISEVELALFTTTLLANPSSLRATSTDSTAPLGIIICLRLSPLASLSLAFSLSLASSLCSQNTCY
jgi:hypothetical protein